jgi:outer membrane protein assembly factor BamB
LLRAVTVRRGLAAAAALTMLAVVLPAISTAANAGLLDPCPKSDWPMFGHDIGRSFASPDTCISPLTAATLIPKWFFNTSSPVTGQPAVVGGTVYAGAFSGGFYAIDAATGKQRWVFQVGGLDREKTDYGKFPDSPTVVTLGGRQMVVVGGGDTLLVINAAGGRLLSSLCLDRVDPTCQGRSGIVSEIESSPAVVPWTPGALWPPADDLVLVGQDANEHDPSPVLGLMAFLLDATGNLTPFWHFDPETGKTYYPMAPVETSGPVDHGCGDVWSSPTVDVTSRTVVFGAGNCDHPTVPTQDESTFAVDLDTGTLKWQASPHPYTAQHDLDFGATPNLLGNGLVGEGGKDGVYYAYPLASPPSAPPGPGAAWKTTVSIGSSVGGMIGSTAVGRAATSSGVHQAVFADTAIPVVTSDPTGSLENILAHPNQAFGIHAVDAVTHQVLWDTPAPPSYGAAGYDNGVVFTPDTLSDSIWVLDANTGLPLRILPLNSPPASPIAVSGDTIYGGAGTTEQSPPFSQLGNLGGVWAFQTLL